MTRCNSNWREFRILSDGRSFLPQWRWRKPSWYQSAGWHNSKYDAYRLLSSAECIIKSWQQEDADWFEVELKEALMCDISS